MLGSRQAIIAALYQLLYAAWLAFELVMAVKLRAELSPRDYLALTGKIAFLSTAILLVRAGRADCLAWHSSMAGPGVRLAGGWLSYSWFTVLAPISVVPLLALQGARSRLLLPPLVSGLVMLVTLLGRVYEPPSLPDVRSLAAAIVVVLVLLTTARPAGKCGKASLAYLMVVPAQLL